VYIFFRMATDSAVPREGNPPPRKKVKRAKAAAPAGEGRQAEEASMVVTPSPHNPATAPVVLFVLEHAGLALGHVGKKSNTLLCSQEHDQWCRSQNRDPARFRPDLVHQTLLAIMDSPLAKAGRVRCLVNTYRSRCIDIQPATRIPRTMKRFQGLVAQVLGIGRGEVASPEGEMLVALSKHPVRAYVPHTTKVFAVSNTAPYCNPRKFAEQVAALPPSDGVLFPDEVQAVVVVNVSGDHLPPPEADYVTDHLALSQYPTSPAAACSKVLDALEAQWGIH